MKKNRKNPVSEYLAAIGGKGGKAAQSKRTKAERRLRAIELNRIRWGKPRSKP